MPTYNQPQNYLTFYAVKGEEGAMAYPVMAGQKALLIDSENAVIYVKSTNALGQVLPLEIYDLVQRPMPQPARTTDLPPAISKEEINEQIKAGIKEALVYYFPERIFKD